MDFAAPVLLPKGILTNTSTVYDEVAGYPIIPLDKVHKYWHVYTTTNKKLKDPTARRLENFWWHVWGSDRSKLSGRVLARIFEDISLGPTVVPLRGPANRWEGPDAPPLTIEVIMAHLQSQARFQQKSASSSSGQPTARSAVPSSSSSLRPPHLPPILKKAGGSSTSVSRNTTRFIFPHESAEEDCVDSDIPSSGSTLASGFDTPEHAIINSPANITRAQSPGWIQSHAAVSKATPDASDTLSPSAAPVSHHPSGHLARNPIQSKHARKHGSEKKKLSNARGGRESPTLEHKPPSSMVAHNNIRLGKQPVRPAPTTLNQHRSTEVSIPMPKPSLFTEATSSTTNIAAHGTIIDQSGSIRDVTAISTSLHDQGEGSSPYGGSSTSSLLESRLTPTQPSSSMVLPLGRTKSQLTLLLEREKERSRN